jgi:hypothetical protein
LPRRGTKRKNGRFRWAVEGFWGLQAVWGRKMPLEVMDGLLGGAAPGKFPRVFRSQSGPLIWLDHHQQVSQLSSPDAYCTSSQLAEVVFRGCWDGRPGAFRMVPAGSPHLPGWLGHWRYATLTPQVPLAKLPTTAPETRPPNGGWRARARGVRCAPFGPARRSSAPRPPPFRLVWPGGRMRAASAGCR